MEWPDTTVKVRVAGGARVTRDHDDGADGSVLGDEAGGVTTGGEDKDGTSVLLERGRDSGHSAGKNDAARPMTTFGRITPAYLPKSCPALLVTITAGTLSYLSSIATSTIELPRSG